VVNCSLPIGALSALVIVLVLRIKRDENLGNATLIERIKELDLIGASILVPAVVMLLLALQWGGTTYPWNNSRIIGLFVGFGLLTILFIYSQIKLGEHATLPPRILMQRSIAAAVGYSILFAGGFFLLVFYLPLYFQGIRGHSATKSGIEVLPILMATVIASMVWGGLVTQFGYYTPFIIAGSVFYAVGAGLITTYNITIPFSRWVGFQILAGIGVGVGFQIPLLAVQTVLPIEDIPIGTACVMFFQSLGGALFISIAQSVFASGFVRGVQRFAPEVDSSILLGSGATRLRETLTRTGQLDKLPQVLLAYMAGLRDAYRVALACACLSVFVACCFEWKSVKDPEVRAKTEGAAIAVGV
jgi:hypothetical protein